MRDLKIAKIHYITTGFLGIKKQKETSWIPKASQKTTGCSSIFQRFPNEDAWQILPRARRWPWVKTHTDGTHPQLNRSWAQTEPKALQAAGIRNIFCGHGNSATSSGTDVHLSGESGSIFIQDKQTYAAKKCPKKIHKVSQPQAINSETYPRVIKHGNGGFNGKII